MVILLLLACAPDWDDGDGDGFLASIDCDDAAAGVHPGAEEGCGDGLDDDCDGSIDEGCGDTGLVTDTGMQDTGGQDTGAPGWEVAATVSGEQAGGGLGAAVAAGELSGDAPADFAIADRAGQVFLLAGPAVGELTAGAAAGVIASAGVASLAAVGDVDGDGYEDLLLGAPSDSSAGEEAGAAWLFAGPLAGSLGTGAARATLTGELAGDRAGTAVAGAGDVNGDGLMDLLVGASYEDAAGTSAGAGYLLLGPVSGLASLSGADVKLHGERRSNLAGEALVGAGDLNGDGVADLAIGAPAQALEGEHAQGAAYIFLGPVTGDLSLSAADAKAHGEVNSAYAGASLAAVGDTDGDGLDDLLVGAPGADEGGDRAGAAYLLVGGEGLSGIFPLSEASASIVGLDDNQQVGDPVAAAGDADGDGRMDLLVGAPFKGDAAGAAFLFTGPVSGALRPATAWAPRSAAGWI
jgi:hypothetical protein